ncbi:hypothetical protein FRB99_003351 [Tulasnella sp. 403]|nr:hypothetical protein FRB99_003351 [Tulasnella sp. 403]
MRLHPCAKLCATSSNQISQGYRTELSCKCNPTAVEDDQDSLPYIAQLALRDDGITDTYTDNAYNVMGVRSFDSDSGSKTGPIFIILVVVSAILVVPLLLRRLKRTISALRRRRAVRFSPSHQPLPIYSNGLPTVGAGPADRTVNDAESIVNTKLRPAYVISAVTATVHPAFHNRKARLSAWPEDGVPNHSPIAWTSADAS